MVQTGRGEPRLAKTKDRLAEEPLDESELVPILRAAIHAREDVVAQQTATIVDLRGELSRFRSAFDAVRQGISFFDGDGRLILANRRYAEIYNSPDGEFTENGSLSEIAQRIRAESQTPSEKGDEGNRRDGLTEERLTWVRALPNGRSIEVRLEPLPSGGWVATHDDVTEAHKSRELVSERMSFQTLFDLVPDNLWVKDVQSRFVFANNATARRMGFASAQDLLGKSDLELCPPETAHKYMADERRVITTGQPLVEEEEYVITADGGKVWILTTKVPVRADDGAIIGLVGVSHDITARKLSDALRDGQADILEMIALGDPLETILARLARLIESQLPGILASVMLVDETGGALRNAAAPSLPPAYVDGIGRVRIGPNAGSCGTAAFRRAPVFVVDTLADPLWADYHALAATHGLRSCWSTPIASRQGQVLGTFALYSHTAREPTASDKRMLDIATNMAGIAIERKLAEDRIQFMATHDALTGLPNRTLLKDRLNQAILVAKRFGRGVAVVFVDLDNFKVVNDSLGHNAGDELLRTVAGRILSQVRAADTVVRIGGDEFVIVLCDQDQEAPSLSATLTRIQDAIAEPVESEGRSFRVTSSLGVASYPADGDDAEALLSNADSAMYRAKEVGRDNFQFYRPEINLKVHEKFRMQEELRLALIRNEFVLHYQPQANLNTHSIFAAEALIRWKHPTRGLLAPASFIPLAEESGMIVPIGEWALNEACRQAKAWQAAGLPPVRVSVNVSPRQFKERQLTATVMQALQKSGLDAKFLELELTESLIMQDVDQAVGTMEELEKLGVQLSIDDFGTGYSSLSALKTFPVARLKIDRTFVKGLPSDADDMAVATAVISLGQKLNLKVIAEGVETAEQLAFLRANNCDEIQGYYVSRPIPPQDFEEFLRKWKQSASIV